MTHRILCLLFFSLLLLASCAPELLSRKAEYISPPPITLENYPSLDGSTSCEPILAVIACHFLDVTCQWRDWITGERMLLPDLTLATGSFSFGAHGTHQAYLNLIDGQSDLILVAREPSEGESRLAADAGVVLDVQPVALDAFVFIVNDENPVDEFTTDEIRQIYQGRLKNWGEVGGMDAEIHPYQRDDDSGSQQLMRALVMRGAAMIEAPSMTLMTMMAPFNAISEDIDGIGYSVYYYEENMAPKAERVKLVAVDGARPDAKNIHDRMYPYTTEVYAVIRTDQPKDSLAYKLRDWLLSVEGQALIEKSGYIPIYSDESQNP